MRRLHWTQPRRVDVWWWMDITAEISATTGELIVMRAGRVAWNANGTGHYRVSLSYEREGVGLYCWPDFLHLSVAQSFVERLMGLALHEAAQLHGTQWPGVLIKESD